MASEVVARYIDGRVVKGISYDIDANKHYCIIWTTDDDSVEVHLAELKALFFVRISSVIPGATRGLSSRPTTSGPRAPSLSTSNSPTESESPG